MIGPNLEISAFKKGIFLFGGSDLIDKCHQDRNPTS